MLNVQTFQGAQLRFAKFYLAKLNAFKEQYQHGGEISITALNQADYDWEQIQQARLWTAENQTNQEIRSLCSRYALAGTEILRFRELPIQRLQWFEDALNAAQAIGETTAIIHHLLYLGITYYDLGQLTEAEQYIETALAQVDSSMPRLEAQVLCQLGKARNDLGKINEAEIDLNHSLALFGELDDQYGLAQTLHYLGLILGKLGRFAEAQQHYQQSLAIYESHQHRLAMTTPLLQLAQLALLQNKPAKALTFLEQALVIRREFKYQQAIADTLKNIGYIHYANEDFAQAEQYYEEATQITMQVGNPLKLASLYGHIGDLRFEQGRYAEALNYYQENLLACREYKQPFGEINTLGCIAAAHHKLGQPDLAIQTFIDSLETALNYESTPFMLDVLSWIADVLREMQKIDLARYIATFLLEYDLSLEYIQLAAKDILEDLPASGQLLQSIPTDHITLTHEILLELNKISHEYLPNK